MFADTVTYPAAFIAGVFSFFSPCILPLIPGYFTFITGYSLDDMTGGAIAGIRKKVFISTLAFVFGFSVVFILLGASASFVGSVLFRYRDGIRIIGGMIIVIFGIHLTGLVRIPLLDFEKRIQLDRKPIHFLGTFIVGMAFGAGWSPCIGPLLGSILVIAGGKETVQEGMVLLGIYSAGLAVPFVTISVFIHFLLVFIKKTAWALKYLNWAAGILLIVLGLLLMTNRLNLIAVSI
ncbi:MAG: cytochrome c biogenesis protein CcdA [Desulfobacterales bacterium]|nr:cytochrome c biogenesis protein CcdA [Desulfobacterales bacterium]